MAVAALGATRLGALAQDATPAAGGTAPEIVTKFLNAYASEDIEAAVALFTPDATFRIEGYGIELSGQDEIRFLHESQFDQHENITFSNVTGFEVPGHVAAEGTWSSTSVFDPPNSNPGPDDITYNFALIGDVTDDGLFSRLSFYFDAFQTMVQQGQAEAIPAGTPPSS